MKKTMWAGVVALGLAVVATGATAMSTVRAAEVRGWESMTVLIDEARENLGNGKCSEMYDPTELQDALRERYEVGTYADEVYSLVQEKSAFVARWICSQHDERGFPTQVLIGGVIGENTAAVYMPTSINDGASRLVEFQPITMHTDWDMGMWYSDVLGKFVIATGYEFDDHMWWSIYALEYQKVSSMQESAAADLVESCHLWPFTDVTDPQESSIECTREYKP